MITFEPLINVEKIRLRHEKNESKYGKKCETIIKM